MKNYVQPGNTITVIAPADVLSGAGVLVGSIFGVAEFDALSGTAVELNLTGVVELPKTSALAINVGDKVYWDNTAKVVNKTASGNTLVGVAVTSADAPSTEAAANPSATVRVRLNASF